MHENILMYSARASNPNRAFKTLFYEPPSRKVTLSDSRKDSDMEAKTKRAGTRKSLRH